jgi:hypothetical protein
VWPYRHAGAGRRELGRVALSSLVKTARRELDARTARGQRMRAHRAERRLAELEAALERLDQGLAPLDVPWYARPAARVATVAGLLAAAVALAGAVAVHGTEGLLVGALDVLLLVAALLWFLVAVCRPRDPKGARGYPPNEGSPPADGGR